MTTTVSSPVTLRVLANDPPLGGHLAVTDSEHELLGLWLDGDVRGGDDYDIEGLWSAIGAHLRGMRPKVVETSDAFTVKVDRQDVTLLPAAFMVGQLPLRMPLTDFANATENWFDAVHPPTAAELRRIRAGW